MSFAAMLDSLQIPILQAPMVGASFDAMAVAVSRAGGMGSLAAAGVAPADMAAVVGSLRAQTDAPFAVNLLMAPPARPESSEVEAALARLAPWYAELGAPLPALPNGFSHDFDAQLDALTRAAPPVASFTFSILTREQMRHAPLVADAIQIMEDQQRAGIKIFYGFREDLDRAPAFQRLGEDFKKHGAAQDLNAAMFDGEILIFSQSYDEVPLGVVGKPTPITMISRLQITWKPDLIRELNPAPLFDMTRYVFEYEGGKSFQAQLARLA